MTGPLPPSPRIVTIDIIRGIALLGILVVNIAGFALPMDAMNNPTIAGVHNDRDFYVWFATDLVVSNSMRGLFSLLFGASILLLTDKIAHNSGPRQAKRYFMRRNLILLFIGLFHAYVMLMPGDVLYFYAVTGFLLYFLKNRKPRTLLLMATVILTLKTLAALYLYLDLQALAMLAQTEGGAYLEDWRATLDGMISSPAEIRREIENVTGGYLQTFQYYAPFTFFIQTAGFLADMMWDVASMMLIGMALYKSGFLQGRKSRRLYAVTMLSGYGIGIAANGLQMAHMIQQDFDLISQLRHHVTFDLSRVALTLGHLSLINLLLSCSLSRAVPRHLFSGLKQALAAVGRMALTNYLMQTLICIILFNGFGFGLFNKLGRADLLGIMVVIWIVQLTISPLWLKYYAYGPVEWLWRSLTRGEFAPLEKSVRPSG